MNLNKSKGSGEIEGGISMTSRILIVENRTLDYRHGQIADVIM
jgi:hypothetical protein